MRRTYFLVQRELWEHRALYLTPMVIACIVTLGVATALVTGGGRIVGFDNMVAGMQVGGQVGSAAGVAALAVGPSTVFVVGLAFLVFFYSIDALYAERKDRSILFWRSIPVTDSETVISKLLTAIVVIPLITFALIVATHLAVLLISSVWVGVRGGNAWHLIWASAPLFDNWSATLIYLLALPLWLSPFIGWFLFVSAYTKRSPFLAAFLPIFILPLLEKMLFDSGVFAEAFFLRSVKMPLFIDLHTMERLFEEGEHFRMVDNAELSLLKLMDVGGFLSTPGLWLGLIGCGLLTAAAIYVRRYRDDS